MEMAAIPPGEEDITPMPEENPNDPFNLDSPDEESIDPVNDLYGLSDEDLRQEMDLAIKRKTTNGQGSSAMSSGAARTTECKPFSASSS